MKSDVKRRTDTFKPELAASPEQVNSSVLFPHLKNCIYLKESTYNGCHTLFLLCLTYFTQYDTL